MNIVSTVAATVATRRPEVEQVIRDFRLILQADNRYWEYAPVAAKALRVLGATPAELQAGDLKGVRKILQPYWDRKAQEARAELAAIASEEARKVSAKKRQEAAGDAFERLIAAGKKTK